MADKNNKLLKEINAIRERDLKDIEDISKLKEEVDSDLLDDLLKIEKEKWESIVEIDNLRKKIDPLKMKRQEERKVLQLAMGSAYISKKLGNVRY